MSPIPITCCAPSFRRRALALVGAVVALLAAGTVGPRWWNEVWPGGASCASAAGHAGLVVDFGTVADAGARPAPTMQSVCLPVSPDENGSQLLEAAGHTLSFNSAGLLCQIDEYPASGCSPGSGGDVEYWSYWHGGSKWTYSGVGPTSYYLHSGDVEGWRFESSDEQPPSAAASGPCPTIAATTTTTSRPPTGGGSATTTPAGSAGRVGSVGSSSSTVVADPSTTAHVGASPQVRAVQAGASTTVTDTSPDPSSAAGTQQVAAPLTHHDDRSSPLPFLLFGSVIVVLGVAAVVITRLRATP